VAAPDAIEPVVGWRCWRVLDAADGFELISANQDTRWPPGLALAATCDEGSPPHPAPHRPPALSCTCGIYAARDPHLLLGYLSPAIRRAATIITPAVMGYDTVMAVGLVSVWGDVIEGELGWRGQYAYPREILIPSAVKHYRRRGRRFRVFDSTDLAKILGDLYDVPTRVARSFRPRTLALQHA
jgi:hypothetical protein